MAKAKRPGNPGVKITVNVAGKRKTFTSIKEAAKAFKIPYQVFYQRVFIMGWTTKDALTTPTRKRKKKVTKKKRK